MHRREVLRRTRELRTPGAAGQVRIPEAVAAMQVAGPAPPGAPGAPPVAAAPAEPSVAAEQHSAVAVQRHNPESHTPDAQSAFPWQRKPANCASTPPSSMPQAMPFR